MSSASPVARWVAIAATVLVGALALPASAGADRGQALYTQYCATCHGAAGKGDGPGAVALSPKPRDLTDRTYLAGLTDQYLANVITKGGAAVGKSPLMPPWGQVLKDEDVRAVLSFLRGLAK